MEIQSSSFFRSEIACRLRRQMAQRVGLQRSAMRAAVVATLAEVRCELSDMGQYQDFGSEDLARWADLREEEARLEEALKTLTR